MITYSLENKKNKTLYEFFYECIKDDIMNGTLKPNEKLPSKRAFATNHGVSIITIENAYDQLMAEGYIYSKARSGFYVSSTISDIQDNYHYRTNPLNQTDNFPITNDNTDNNFSINNNKNSYCSTPDNNKNNRIKQANTAKSVSLISNHTNKDNFPFSVWAKINRQVLSAADENLLTPPPVGGVIELRKAIAKHLYDFRGINVSYEQIIIGAGTEYLYNLIVQLLGRGKKFGLENPGSQKIRSIYKTLGVEIVPLSMDIEGIELTYENLSSSDIIQLSPSHHFPTGFVTPVNRRYRLLQWANEASDRYLIEDDYDSEFRLQGKPIPSLFSMDNTDKVIYLNTFTKSLASTIRISYMVLPNKLLETYRRNLSFYSCTVSNFEQYILASFIDNNHFEKHINRMRTHYRKLRDTLITSIKKSNLNSLIKIDGEDSGLHFLMHIKTEKNDQLLKQLAANERVLISFLSEYLFDDNNLFNGENGSYNDKYSHTAIVNYSGLNESMIENIVKALERAWT